jgi:hypothetical protein
MPFPQVTTERRAMFISTSRWQPLTNSLLRAMRTRSSFGMAIGPEIGVPAAGSETTGETPLRLDELVDALNEIPKVAFFYASS